jgi:nicotinamidase-related amidase
MLVVTCHDRVQEVHNTYGEGGGKMTSSDDQNVLYVGTLDVYTVQPHKTGLLVIDMVYGSAHGDYGWAKMYRQMGMEDVYDYYLKRLQDTVIPNIKNLQEAFRRRNMQVVFTTVASEREDFSDWTPRVLRQIRDWTERGVDHPYNHIWDDDAQILDELAPASGEQVINKLRFSAFNGSNIDEVLQELGLELLVFTGVGTNYCVQCTLMDAYDHGYECILVEDATGTLTQEVQDIAIRSMEPYAKIMSTNELLQELETATAVSKPAV